MSINIQTSGDVYDVVIVGSGAGGGMAANVLSEKGLSVAVVEAGGYYDPAMNEYRTQLRWPWESPRRGANTVRAFGDFDAAWGGRSEEHTSELQSRGHIVCRLLLE